MSIEDNKRLVADYLAHFRKFDVDAVLGMMSDDATWWVAGRPDLYPDAGTRTKSEMADAWRAMSNVFDGGLAMDIKGLVAEGDRVAAEVRSDAVTKAGKAYQNDYHMLFTIRDGKIVGVREYTDLLYAVAVFG